MSTLDRPRFQNRNGAIRRSALALSAAMAAIVALASGPAITANAQEQEQEQPRNETQLPPAGTDDGGDHVIGDLSEAAVQELIDVIERLSAENRELRGRVARLELDRAAAEKQRDELQQFIDSYAEYGDAFEEYQLFRQKAEREERARLEAERRAEREEQMRRAREARESRRAAAQNRGPEKDPYAERIEKLEDAGFTRIGELVFVDGMGTTYRTETEREIRYSPILDLWYTDEEEIVDWSELTLSGSVIHAHANPADIVFAIAFYNDENHQIGQTTVRVDGAKPGVPYPFTANIDMASEGPFESYNAWVLTFNPHEPQPPPPNTSP